MNYDRLSRRPRLILDENIDFSSMDILLRHGLAQRCSRVYQSWCKEKSLDTQGAPANARLRSLIRKALDDEAELPTNR